MAEESTESQRSVVEPNGEPQTPAVDWKAKCEDVISHSHEREKRAKANKSAIDELEQLKQSDRTPNASPGASAETPASADTRKPLSAPTIKHDDASKYFGKPLWQGRFANPR
ncbi:hypothetical protein [Bifidobacterium callimiconis]|uniref:Helicase n=1 Tax=Bifidobacterium callimiconis TaxID=2306973 RepID=A0A430FHU2_9BIFI|nr:hypothetical protein [Bifidobacterium callimiconis]RSX52416.1 helicase [Bifidobacterium callimiconis]